MDIVQLYICKKCAWKGSEDQLDYDLVETCFGNDQVETCPECGSCEVMHVEMKDIQ